VSSSILGLVVGEVAPEAVGGEAGGSGLMIGEGVAEALEVVSLCGEGDRMAWRFRGVRCVGLVRLVIIGICGGLVEIVVGLMTDGCAVAVGMIGMVGVWICALVVDVACVDCMDVDVLFVVLLLCALPACVTFGWYPIAFAYRLMDVSKFFTMESSMVEEREICGGCCVALGKNNFVCSVGLNQDRIVSSVFDFIVSGSLT